MRMISEYFFDGLLALFLFLLGVNGDTRLT